ncbi:MAG: hypothetical protein E6Q62_01195 [Nitrosomonas sp.]|nr:MAG: hypothetical protein E6Q62_01195 [Nitrosomonas sp.]
MNRKNMTWHLTDSNGKHIVQVCGDDTCQVEALSNYIQDGLLNEEAVVVFAKPALRKHVISHLSALNFDVQALKDKGQVKFFDAEFMISSLLIDETIDQQAFYELVESQIETLHSKCGKIRVFGGMVATLWNTGRYEAAMQLEELWIGLTQKYDFSLLCSYSLGNFDPANYEETLQRIFNCHNYLTPVEVDDSSDNSGSVGEAVMDVLTLAWNRAAKEVNKAKQNLNQSPSSGLLN